MKLPLFKPVSLIVIGLLFCFDFTIASACPMTLPVMDIHVKDAALTLEIAATPEARKCGLSRRNTLPPNRGMLFVVPKPIILDFWMVDTMLPLSIAFLNEDGRILSIEAMAPDKPRNHYRSPEPALYAIEVNKGWFTEHDIKVGDVVDIKLPVMFLIR